MNNLLYKVSNFKNDDILINKIVELWNQEIGFIFPFTKEMFIQKTIDCKYIDYDSSFVATIDNDVVGFIISKVYDNNEIMSKYIDKAWISLFYVSRKYRRNGIGSNLLEKNESILKQKGIIEILFGSDYDNFFPGIPNDFDNLTEPFLTKRGYNCGRYTHDLIRKLKHTTDEKYDHSLRYATKDDKRIVLEFFEKNFYGRWYYEALEYFENDEIEKEYLLSFEGDIMTGFLRINRGIINKISYNMNWSLRFDKLVGIGPLGVAREYRKRKIAKSLINKGLNDCTIEGYTDALIDWTGLMEIYQKYGFEVWKCYQYASKRIKID